MNQTAATLKMSIPLHGHMCMCLCSAMPHEDREIPA